MFVVLEESFLVLLTPYHVILGDTQITAASLFSCSVSVLEF